MYAFKINLCNKRFCNQMNKFIIVVVTERTAVYFFFVFSRVWHTEQQSRAHTDPNTTRTGSPSATHNQKFFPRIKTAYNKIQAQILLHVAGVL